MIIQQCIEQLHIKQSFLLFNQNINIEAFQMKLDHQCTSCDYKLGEEG